MFPILLLIFFDAAAINIAIPSITPLLMQKTHCLLSCQVSAFYRDVMFGFTLGIYPFFIFLCTPSLGRLSDVLGRKKILLTCLVGTTISYLLCAMAIHLANYLLFITALTLAGAMSATQTIAAAIIVDKSSAISKKYNLTKAILTGSLGLIIGPACYYLAIKKGFIHCNLTLPFYFAASLALLNVLVALLFVKGNRTPQLAMVNTPKTSGLRVFINSFKSKKFTYLICFYFLYAMGWSLYFQSINWLFADKFSYSADKISNFIAFLGISYLLASYLHNLLEAKFAPDSTNAFGLVVIFMGIVNVMSAYIDSETWLWVIGFGNGIANILCYTYALNIFSDTTASDSQGWIIGIVSAVGSITWTVSGLLLGPLEYCNFRAPLVFSSVLCLLSFYTLARFKGAAAKLTTATDL